MQDIIKRIREGGEQGIKYPLPSTDRRMSAYNRIEELRPGIRRKILTEDLSQFRRPTGRRIKNREHTAAMALRMKHGGKFRPIQIQVVPGIKDVQVIDGAHRLEAARMIGARRVPVVVATPDQMMHRTYTGKDRLVASHERRQALEMQSKPRRIYTHSELKYLAERAPKKGSWEHKVNELLARHAMDYDISPSDYRPRRRRVVAKKWEENDWKRDKSGRFGGYIGAADDKKEEKKPPGRQLPPAPGTQVANKDEMTKGEKIGAVAGWSLLAAGSLAVGAAVFNAHNPVVSDAVKRAFSKGKVTHYNAATDVAWNATADYADTITATKAWAVPAHVELYGSLGQGMAEVDPEALQAITTAMYTGKSLPRLTGVQQQKILAKSGASVLDVKIAAGNLREHYKTAAVLTPAMDEMDDISLLVAHNQNLHLLMMQQQLTAMGHDVGKIGDSRHMRGLIELTSEGTPWHDERIQRFQEVVKGKFAPEATTEHFQKGMGESLGTAGAGVGPQGSWVLRVEDKKIIKDPKYLDDLATATYMNTQMWMQSMGIESVHLVRGQSLKFTDAAELPYKEWAEVDVNPQPFTSWSSNPHAALGYVDPASQGVKSLSGREPVLMRRTVPREEILAYSPLGTGHVAASEWLVLGGPQSVQIKRLTPSEATERSQRLFKAVGAVPYKSAKQRAFMHAKHPDIAARWDKEYGGKIKRKKVRKYDELVPMMDEIDKGLYGAFQQKRKKNRDLRSQKTPYGYGEQHNTWVRKAKTRSPEEQRTHDRRMKAALIAAGATGAGLATVGGLGYAAHKRGFKPVGRAVLSDIPGIEDYKMTRRAQAGANARAFGQSLKTGLGGSAASTENWDSALDRMTQFQNAHDAPSRLETLLEEFLHAPTGPSGKGHLATGGALLGAGLTLGAAGGGAAYTAHQQNKKEEVGKATHPRHVVWEGEAPSEEEIETARRKKKRQRIVAGTVLGAGALATAGTLAAAAHGGYRPMVATPIGLGRVGSKGGWTNLLDPGDTKKVHVSNALFTLMGQGKLARANVSANIAGVKGGLANESAAAGEVFRRASRKRAHKKAAQWAKPGAALVPYGKSLFGSHSARPGSHERGQHGKTALRVSPDERAALAVLGAGTAGLGAAAVAGGYRPIGRDVKWPEHWGIGNKPANWNLKRPPDQIVTENLRGIGRGLKNIGQQAADNPGVAVGTLVGLGSTGVAIHQGVRAYSRRKEKDLPYKHAAKHIKRLENMEGKSPELERALQGMRANANKQVRGMPRTALDELNQMGYKYGYANSGRYDRAYGPFPVKEPGIQEAADYRHRTKKNWEPVEKSKFTRQVNREFDKETIKEAKRKTRPSRFKARVAGDVASYGTALGIATAANKTIKPENRTKGMLIGVGISGGIARGLVGGQVQQTTLKHSLRGQVRRGELTPRQAQASYDWQTYDPFAYSVEHAQELDAMLKKNPKLRMGDIEAGVYRDYLSSFKKYDNMVDVAKRLLERG